jgi:hypothetical protein
MTRWLPVVGWETTHQVSSQGEIASLPRLGNSDKRRNTSGQILSQSKSGSYLTVNLRAPGRRASCRVHVLVAEAFLGSCPPGHEICHGPGGCFDNSVANLSYGTPAKNQQDKIRDGTDNRGIRHWNVKLNENQVREIRSLYARGGISQSTLAKMYLVTRETIRDVVSYRSWRHLDG